VVVAVVLGIFFPTLKHFMHVSNGYGAKLACSLVFVAGRRSDLQDAIPNEFTWPPIRFFTKLTVEKEKLCVLAESRFLPNMSSRACHVTERLGCHLLHPDVKPYKARNPKEISGGGRQTDKPFPLGDHIDEEKKRRALEGVDMKALQVAADKHFADTSINSRAFIVVRDGQIVYERYGEGFNEDKRLIGWSMTKAWTNTLIGLRVMDGVISLDDEIDLPEFEEDERSKLKVRDLLRMCDGIDFDESYEPGADAPNMLFAQPKLVLKERKIRHRSKEEGFPCFHYSSHTTNILMEFLRKSFKTDQEYWNYPTERFFNKLGMVSAVLETDPTGTFIGSSFGWATARDWARFGLFFLNDGVWNGERLLPEGWVEFSSNATWTSDGLYGAQFWGNLVPDPRDTPDQLKHCDKVYHTRRRENMQWSKEAFPLHSFAALGFEEQAVVIHQPENLVVVRMGQTNELISWDRVGFFGEVFKALIPSK